jgi:hypothetical protein
VSTIFRICATAHQARTALDASSRGNGAVICLALWKIGEVEPVRVMGAEGYPYGFNVTTEDGKPLVSFAYASRALAEAAATHLESALLNAISVHPYAE